MHKRGEDMYNSDTITIFWQISVTLAIFANALLLYQTRQQLKRIDLIVVNIKSLNKKEK